MRRLFWIAATAAIALGATGVAVAELKADRSASPVTASFSATTVEKRSVAVCGAGDGTVQVTNALYSGQSSGDPSLAGAIKIAIRAAVSTTKSLGTVDGFLSSGSTKAHLTGVYRNGKITGLLAGVAGGQRLVGTFTTAWTSETGFTGGSIGNGAPFPLAVVATDGVCKPAKPAKR